MKIRKEKDEFRAYFEESIPKERKNPKKIILQSIGIFVILIAFICFYLLILNFDKVIKLLPFFKDESGKIVLKKPDENKKDHQSSEDKSKLVKPESTTLSKVNSLQGITYDIKDVNVDDKGMYITISIESTKELDFNIVCDQILVDGFPIKDKFSVSISGLEQIEETITILKTELDPLEIYQPSQIKLFMSQTNIEKDKDKDYILVINNIYLTSQSAVKRETILVDEVGDVKIHFYKKVVDSDYTYIYFFFQNASSYHRNIQIKKLAINDELYEYKDFNINIYRNSKNISYIKIPRKEYKEVKNYSISFFVIGREEDSIANGIYMTNDFTSNS